MTGQTYYRIVVSGELSERWSEWFDNFEISPESQLDGEVSTTITGPIVDQAALRGILMALWDLNLTLLSVNRLSTS